jgi:hypothetical protein
MVLALEHRTNTVSSLVVPLPMVGAWTGSTRRITGTVSSSCDPGGRRIPRARMLLLGDEWRVRFESGAQSTCRGGHYLQSC